MRQILLKKLFFSHESRNVKFARILVAVGNSPVPMDPLAGIYHWLVSYLRSHTYCVVTAAHDYLRTRHQVATAISPLPPSSVVYMYLHMYTMAYRYVNLRIILVPLVLPLYLAF